MVCQCLALIMGFVSVCLRKWHARVRWCVLVCVCVCARGTWKKKKKRTYIYVQVIIFSRAAETVCV